MRACVFVIMMGMTDPLDSFYMPLCRFIIYSGSYI